MGRQALGGEGPVEGSGHARRSLRISSQECAALGMTLCFASIILLQGVGLEKSIVTAVATTAAVLVVFALPRAIGNLINVLRDISSQLKRSNET